MTALGNFRTGRYSLLGVSKEEKEDMCIAVPHCSRTV